MVVGARPFPPPLHLSLSIGPSCCLPSFLPCSSTELARVPTRARKETGQSALQIGRYGLGKKGGASRRPCTDREEGVLQSHPSPPPPHHHQICRSIKREKVTRFGWSPCPSPLNNPKQVAKLHRIIRIHCSLRCKVLERKWALAFISPLETPISIHPSPSLTPSCYTTLSLPPLLSFPLTNTSSLLQRRRRHSLHPFQVL